MKLFSILGFFVQAYNLQREEEIPTTAQTELETNAATISSTSVSTVADTTTEATGTCKPPEPTLWGNPATDCLGFGKACEIDEIFAEQEKMRRFPVFEI